MTTENGDHSRGFSVPFDPTVVVAVDESTTPDGYPLPSRNPQVTMVPGGAGLVVRRRSHV
jgi:hypothetical protein